MFNLLEPATGDNVDFWPLTGESFDSSRFSRRQLQSVFGVELSVSSPEDTILAKLRWMNLSGGSEKQFIDALRVYEVQFEGLDLNYLRDWAKRLGVDQLLEKLEAEAEAM